MTRDKHHHVICSTCLGEYQGHCGYGDILNKKGVVLLQPMWLGEAPHEEFCCLCGQASVTAACFFTEPGKDHWLSAKCDWDHSELVENS